MRPACPLLGLLLALTSAARPLRAQAAAAVERAIQPFTPPRWRARWATGASSCSARRPRRRRGLGPRTYGDNSRRPRQVAMSPEGGIERVMAAAGHPVAWLDLGPAAVGAVRPWGDGEHWYVRGDAVQRMRPGRECDALVYVDGVSVAAYR